MNTCELTERAREQAIFPKNSEVICLRRPLARRQQKLIVPAGRRVCRRPQTRAERGSDAGEMQLGRVCGRRQTRAGRASDAVFDKLFLGGTVLQELEPFRKALLRGTWKDSASAAFKIKQLKIELLRFAARD